MTSNARAFLTLVSALAAPLGPLLSAATVTGSVPLPPDEPGEVMAKRYNIVSKRGVLTPSPPYAVVWLEDGKKRSPSDETVELIQQDFVFAPSILPIQVGTTVSFPNYDDEYHNVFSYSKTKRFDLGRYMPDERPIPTQTFDTPGQVVLRCDVHEHMKAVILVLDTPFYTSSDTDGEFELTEVPPGEYTIKAWVDTKTVFERKIQITDGQQSRVVFE